MKYRIKQLMEMQQMSQKNFADYLGISQATLSSIFSERTKPTLAIAESIANRFPMIRLEWLIMGIGEMYKKDFVASPENDEKKTISGDKHLSPMFDPEEGETMDEILSSKVSRVEPTIVLPKIKKREIKEVRIFFDDGTYETFESTSKR